MTESIHLLRKSAPIVVYCEYLEPLNECYDTLMKSGIVIKLQILDTWTREYQTLPGRTHPEMFISSTGGFLLIGTRI